MIRRMALLALAGAALSGCIREARIAMPSELATSTETLALTGMGLEQRGDFTFAGATGAFTRGAERLALLDPFLVQQRGGGSFRYVASGLTLAGGCGYRQGEVNVGVISARTRHFAYRCLLGRNGMPAGELVIEAERGTMGSALSKEGRHGYLLFGGDRYDIHSIHRDAGGGLASATPLGYRFEQNGRAVGAVDLNGPNKTVFAPAAGNGREAVFAGSMALSVLWDPATL
jgi:hypothetical protein